jgi:hypothetical protein
MSGLVVVIIITLAVVSCLIISVNIFSYHLILKSAKRLSASGALDEEFKKEEEDNKKPHKKVLNIVAQVASGVVCVGLVSLALVSGIYHARGENFVTNNHVSFAIATNSMEGYIDDDYKSSLINSYIEYYEVDEITAEKKLKKDQFGVGDFLTFATIKADEELHIYDVYGYKNAKGKIITHRLVGVYEDGSLKFRGDNAGGIDKKVNREQVLYRYSGNNAKHVGLIVLFFGSGYGIYSIFAVITMYVISDIAIYKWEKIKKSRLIQLGLVTEKKKKKDEK